MTSEERHQARFERRKAKREARRRAKLSRYDDYEHVISLNSLNRAADDASKGVKWKASVQRYNANRLLNIYRTRVDLMAGKDIRKGFICFDLMERGKLRHIKSVHFSERVVQKSLCQNALYPILTNSLIYDSGASQKGKGTQFAIDRLTEHLRRHYRHYGREGGILLIDFSDYFGKADHEALKKIYDRNFHDERLKTLGFLFIDAFGDIGLGLGSETSQINAITLRSPSDHYVKEILRIKGYEVYMDDSALVHHSTDYLKECLNKLRAKYAEYGITINERKTRICDLKHGFVFLKTHFFITDTGRIIRTPCRKSVTNERHRLKKQAGLLTSGIMNFEDIRTSYASWRGSMSHRNAYYTVHNMDRLFNRIYIDEWKRTDSQGTEDLNHTKDDKYDHSLHAAIRPAVWLSHAE